jgi:hypothetical protein
MSRRREATGGLGQEERQDQEQRERAAAAPTVPASGKGGASRRSLRDARRVHRHPNRCNLAHPWVGRSAEWGLGGAIGREDPRDTAGDPDTVALDAAARSIA